MCKSNNIHGVARIFSSLLQAAPGKFAGLPTHNPYAFALSAISVLLFTNEELGGSLLFKSKKSEKPGLEQKRVETFLGNET